MGWTTPELPLLMGDLDPIYGSLAMPASFPNSMSIGATVFAELTKVRNRETRILTLTLLRL